MRKEQAVGRHHQGVSAEGTHLLYLGRRFQACRLADFEPSRGRKAFHGAGYGLQPATRGSIGLGKDQDDLVSRRNEGRQSPLSELGRAGED